MKILNDEGLLLEVESYLKREISSVETSNDQMVKVYFGERTYDKHNIEYKSFSAQITAVTINGSRPYVVEQVEGLVKASGMYRFESGGGKGFIVSVRFTVEMDRQSSGFKNLRFSS